MGFWRKVKKDIQKGFKDGFYFMKGGVLSVKKRTKQLTKEGQKKFELYELHSKVQKEMTELGGRIYELSAKKKNPMLDRKVKAISEKIEKFEAKIAKLEGKVKKVSKKVPKNITQKNNTKAKSKE